MALIFSVVHDFDGQDAIPGSGNLLSWGTSSTGLLGNGTTSPDVLSPTQITNFDNWDQISVGASHCLALRDGKLYSWGSRSSGRLGDGSTSGTVLTPTQVGTSTDWAKIAAGSSHGSAIKKDGSLWAWGPNNSTGLGSSGTTTTPTQVGSSTNWVSISAGAQCGFGINTAGELYAWGINADGRTGLGITSFTVTPSPTRVGSFSDWTTVSSFGNSSSSVSFGIRNGLLYVWGRGEAILGQNLSATTTRSTPSQVGTGSGWESITHSVSAALAIRSGGELWTWGENSSGELGLGNTTVQRVPVQLGSSSSWAKVSAPVSAAITSNGELWTWGTNSSGKLGQGDTTSRTTPTRVGTGSSWQNIASNASTVLAIKS